VSDHCPNCGQSILETDTVCWHCGWKLPRRTGAKIKPAPAHLDETDQQPYSLKLIAGYGVITGLVIVAALLVIAALGNRPRVITTEDTKLKPGWTAVTDRSISFTLNLPDGWVFQEPAGPQESLLLTDQIESDALMRATISPFGRFDSNLSLRLLAANGPIRESRPNSFLIIVEDNRQKQLSLNEAVALLENSTPGLVILRTDVGESLRGEPQANFLVRVVGGNPPTSLLRCQQEFVRSDPASFILSACAAPSVYPALSTNLHDILASFQLLSGAFQMSCTQTIP